MNFKILSHACLLVRTENASIVIDPWLLGSCYWRSWWNFPEPSFDEEELAQVDAVVISHIHWDHWHGPTLKKLFRGKPVYIPDEPGLRSGDDLRAIGFKDVIRVPHAETVRVKDIAITMYQFGLFLNDAAVVVEADGVKVLNANDAKVAGWALDDIVDRHGPFDFALRSHSSANTRICYSIEGDDAFAQDDRDHYFRSFKAFMDRVRPRHAIPFASNHCHLHDDVFALNNYISNPLQLKQFIDDVETPMDWTLKVMLPGSEWSQARGFELRDEQCFRDLPGELAAYRERVADKLDAYRDYENRVAISDSIRQRFVALLRSSGALRGGPGRFALTTFWPDGREETFTVDLRSGVLDVVAPMGKPAPGLPLIRMPAVVFRDAVIKNMFHHAGISKRCRFIASNAAELALLRRVLARLDRSEHGVAPFTGSMARRLAQAYLRRWRELFVYLHAAWLIKIRRKPIYLAEEAILRGEL